MKSKKRYSVFFLALLCASITGCATQEDRWDTRADKDIRQTPGAYIDDSMITTKVKSAIFGEPGLDSAEINVETYQGNVQLSGFVDSQDKITRAVEVTRQVDGVRTVKNDLRLKSRY